MQDPATGKWWYSYGEPVKGLGTSVNPKDFKPIPDGSTKIGTIHSHLHGRNYESAGIKQEGYNPNDTFSDGDIEIYCYGQYDPNDPEKKRIIYHGLILYNVNGNTGRVDKFTRNPFENYPHHVPTKDIPNLPGFKKGKQWKPSPTGPYNGG